MLMAKTTKNVVQSLTEIREVLETAYNQLKNLESLRKTMIDVIIRINDIIDTLELDAVVDAITELDTLERVGDRNDGN